MSRGAVVLAGAAALAVMVGGCQKKAAKSDPDSVKSAIQADQKKWNDEFQAKDQEALVNHYADDAYFAGPGIKGANGATAIRQVYATGLADPAFALSIGVDKVDAAASGDMAYARGHFTEKYTDPKTNKVMTNSGEYVTVYKKQQDGTWKAVEDFASADPDSVKPVAPGKAVTHAAMM